MIFPRVGTCVNKSHLQIINSIGYNALKFQGNINWMYCNKNKWSEVNIDMKVVIWGLSNWTPILFDGSHCGKLRKTWGGGVNHMRKPFPLFIITYSKDKIMIVSFDNLYHIIFLTILTISLEKQENMLDCFWN